MMKVNFLFITVLLSSSLSANAQDDEFRKKYEEFKRQAHEQYEDFRDKANKEYAEFREDAWKEFKRMPAIPKPKDEEIEPIDIPEEELNKPVEDNPLPFDEVVTPPQPQPQPKPVSPIKEQPQTEENNISFLYFGTNCKVRIPENKSLSLTKFSESELNKAWEELSSANYNNTIMDCLNLRTRLQLSDWAYLNMLNTFVESYYGKGNEANLLMAFLYCQSGYKMRLGNDDGKVWLLFASKHDIWDIPYYLVDNEKYYSFNCDAEKLSIRCVGYPRETSLSLLIQQPHLFSYNETEPRTLTSKRYPDISVNISVNKNIIDFYNTYPISYLDNNFMTKWAMYANTPIDEKVKSQLYPLLKDKITGLSQREAANRLLDWVQMAFVYELDDKVWGYDRAFFAEESLYYPYCDCEDRSILFSHLVRDLLGLKVLLVYYPGHLATAVNFTENVQGDYIPLHGEKYVVCDPTFLGASVGMTMTDMDNSKATVILLE